MLAAHAPALRARRAPALPPSLAASLATLLAAAPGAARAQGATESPPPGGFVRMVFGRYNTNDDDALDGVELAWCRCGDFDADRDAAVSRAEFDAGYRAAGLRRRVMLHTVQRPTPRDGAAPARASAATAAPAATAARWQGSGRVEVLTGGRWQPGTVVSLGEGADAGKVYVRLDEYFGGVGGTVTADLARVRRIDPSPPPPASDAGRAVRVRCQGIYKLARIVAVSGARYRVRHDDPDDGCPADEWVTADLLKTVNYGDFRPANPRYDYGAARGLPAALPAGLYVCHTSLTYNTSTLVTVGRLRLRGDGTYMGMSPDGTGNGGRYRYDRAAATVTWVGGLRGFAGQETGTGVTADPKTGAPHLNINYTVRPGGSQYTAECYREGA